MSRAIGFLIGLISLSPGVARSQAQLQDSSLARAAELLDRSPLLDPTMSVVREAQFVRDVELLVSSIPGQDTIGLDTTAVERSALRATRLLEDMLKHKTVQAIIRSTPTGLAVTYRRFVDTDAPEERATTQDTVSLQPALYLFISKDPKTGREDQQRKSCATHCTVSFNFQGQ